MAVRGQDLISKGEHIHVISLWGERSTAGNTNLVNQMRNSLMNHPGPSEPKVITRRYKLNNSTGELTSKETTPLASHTTSASISLHLFNLKSVDAHAMKTAIEVVRKEVVESTPPHKAIHVFFDEITTVK